MPKACPYCGTSIVSDEVALCPACTVKKVFGFEEMPRIKELMAGKFHLGEKLGEGGFGVVYRSEQIDPIQRDVAIKIIKRGMDSEQVIARFEAERQALAQLDHPGIAKLYEAGTTEEGRPFFAMELVEGHPITDHCRNLSQRERLELFSKVCDAVQHAHHRGIIHRDLKPSNILVTPDGELKIIDFGIAKATTKLLTEKTLLTEFHQFIGTPAYVSPEQAAMTGKPVDTRSDLYSLGVLLYELLTGQPPFDEKRFAEAGLGEILRVIREEEPSKPSTRIASKIERDLDWVVMCALEKNPDRRYSSAHEFSNDVRRFLSHQPVEASPPSKLYRLQKFVHRNKGGVLAASIAILSLIGGLVVASYGLMRAQQEAKAAQTQADRANTVIRFIDEMFSSADPFLSGGTNYTVHQLLNDYSEEFEGKLDTQPEVELSLQRTIASAYEGLGEYQSAERHYRRAYELAPGPDLKNKLAWTLRNQGHYQEALDQTQNPILRIELNRLLGQHDVALQLAKKTESNTQRGLTILALTHAEAGDFKTANDLAQQALDIAKKKHGKNSARLIRPLDTLARIAEKQGVLTTHSQTARDIARATLPEDHPARLFAETRAAQRSEQKSLTTRLLEKVGSKPETFTPILKLVASLASEGKSTDARNFLTEKLGLDYENFRNGQPITIGSAGPLVKKIMREGRVKNYIPLIEQALSVGSKIFGEDHAHTVELKRLLAYMYRWDHRYPESEELSRQAIAHYGPRHPATFDCLFHLHETLRDQNRELETDDLLALQKLGERYINHGRLLTAQKFLDRALAICRKQHGNEHPETFKTLALLGELEVQHLWIRQIARGPLLIEAYELSKKLYGLDSLETAHCLRRLDSDNAELLGVRETLKLLETALAQATKPEVTKLLTQLIRQRKDFISRYQKSAHTLLEKFKISPSAKVLADTTFREIRAGNFESGRKHLAQALALSPGDPEVENVLSWTEWRSGNRELAKKAALTSYFKHFGDHTVLPSAPYRAYLLRNASRASWDEGDLSDFWKNFDDLDQAGTILLPRASLWRHSAKPLDNWTAPDFSQRILWGRSHTPVTDYRIAANTHITHQLGPRYFRTSFEVRDPSEFKKLKLRLTRWAGAVIHLNGHEVAKENYPDITPEPSGQMNPRIITFDITHLRPGKNTLAIEVHRYAPNAHLYFECQLEGL